MKQELLIFIAVIIVSVFGLIIHTTVNQEITGQQVRGLKPFFSEQDKMCLQDLSNCIKNCEKNHPYSEVTAKCQNKCRKEPTKIVNNVESTKFVTWCETNCVKNNEKLGLQLNNCWWHCKNNRACGKKIIGLA